MNIKCYRNENDGLIGAFHTRGELTHKLFDTTGLKWKIFIVKVIMRMLVRATENSSGKREDLLLLIQENLRAHPDSPAIKFE